MRRYLMLGMIEKGRDSLERRIDYRVAASVRALLSRLPHMLLRFYGLSGLHICLVSLRN